MKRITVTLTDEQYERLWREHINSRLPLAQVLLTLAFRAGDPPLKPIRHRLGKP